MTTPEDILHVMEFRRRYELDAYTDQALNQLNRTISQVEREIVRQWGKVGLRTEFSQGRAIALLEELRGVTGAVKATLSHDIAKVAGDVAARSAADLSRSLSFNGRAANVTEVMLDPGTMASYWQKTPVGGHLLREWVDKSFDKHTVDRIKQEIGAGLLRAETYDQLADRLKVGFGMTKNEIDTLVRTTVRTAHDDAQKRVYEQNRDLYTTLRWTASINDRTCLLCASLEGRNYPLEDHPPCPVHPRCRCTLLANLKSLKELGLTNRDVEEFAQEEKIVSPTHKGYRGRALARKGLSMGDWLRSLPAEQQRQYFGPTRHALLEAGFIKFTDLVDLDQLRIRTLDELPTPAGMTTAEAIKAATAVAIIKRANTPAELEALLQFEVDAFMEAIAVGTTPEDKKRRLRAINALRKRLKMPKLTLEMLQNSQ